MISVKRVQRKRTKGWRMPPNTKYVGRGSQWGNPYKLNNHTPEEYNHALKTYRKYATEQLKQNPDWLAPIRGMNLACWCSLEKPCHADILLEIANE